MLISGHFEHYLDAILTSRKPHSCCFSTNLTYLRGKYKRYRSSFDTYQVLSNAKFARVPTFVWYVLNSLCRFLWVCVSGLKTTSLLRLVNRRLNMPTSECAPVSPSLYQCQIFLQKNARFTCQKTTFHFAILYTCMCKTAAYGLEGRFTGLWKRSLRSSTSRAASQIV